MVVGGLGNASSSNAVKAELQEAMTRAVLDMYHKRADGFNGIVFVIYASNELRQKGMTNFNGSKTGMDDNQKFMNLDLPVEDRATKVYLFELQEAAYRVEDPERVRALDDDVLSVVNVPVFMASLDNSR